MRHTLYDEALRDLRSPKIRLGAPMFQRGAAPPLESSLNDQRTCKEGIPPKSAPVIKGYGSL